jgi:nucleoside-diphosphate-sugar epimerase
MKTAIITGATGMIGTALILECLKKGMRVTAVVRPASARLDRIPSLDGLTVIKCGLEEMDKLPGLAAGGQDVFFHLGWGDTDRSGRNDAQKQQKNVEASLKAAGAAAKLKCKVFVGAGSQAEYGRYDVPIREDFEKKPDTAYGRAKIDACKTSAEFCSGSGIKHVWARIFSVYGPNDTPASMVMYCIDRMLKKERVSLSACTQTWDFLYCADAARALMFAAESGRDREAYNVGSGTGRKLMEYVNIIAKAAGNKAELGFGDVAAPAAGLQNLTADISKIAGHTGFKPAVSFEQGIKETIKWCEENRK